MSTNVPKGIIVDDGYGNKQIRKSSANYFWGDQAKPIIFKWKPKAKIPQLQTLIEMFDGTDIAIAGGAILASYDAVEYSDIDVFPLKKTAVKVCTDILSNLGYKETKKEDHYLLYERSDSSFRPVQVILLHTDVDGDVQRVINRFDISVCQVAVKDKNLHSNTIAIEDIGSKIMRANKTMNICSLFKRITKYSERGYGVLDGVSDEEYQKRKDEKSKSNTAG